MVACPIHLEFSLNQAASVFLQYSAVYLWLSFVAFGEKCWETAKSKKTKNWLWMT